MKTIAFLLLSAAFVGFGRPALAQDTSQGSTIDSGSTVPGILGYFDPKTGTFRLAQQAAEISPALTFSTLTGEIEYKITVTIRSTISPTVPIVCSGSATTIDSGSGTSHTESASLDASRSGATATCTVIIPYAWSLASATTDSVSLGYSVSAAGTGGVVSRISSHSLPAIKVPVNNTTTVETVAVTM